MCQIMFHILVSLCNCYWPVAAPHEDQLCADRRNCHYQIPVFKCLQEISVCVECLKDPETREARRRDFDAMHGSISDLRLQR
jgi:hypothetical protein